MTEAVVKLGVIGCGFTGRVSTQGTTLSPHIETVAVADLNEERRRSVAEEFGVPNQHGPYEDLLNDTDVEAVYIGTRLKDRLTIVLKTLEAGKHALVQKPHAIRAADILEMKKAAETAGVTLQFCYYLRHFPWNRATRVAINNGRIGEPYHGRYFSKNSERASAIDDGWNLEYGNKGGVLAEHMSHDLDLLWWWMGCPKPQWVFGVKHSINPEPGPLEPVEDYFSGIVGFDGHKTIQIDCSSISHADSARVLELHGSEGAISGTQRCGLSRRDERLGDELISRRRDGGYATEEIAESSDVPHTELQPEGIPPFFYEVEHFALAIKGVVAPDVPADEAYEFCRILDGLYESALKGERVSLTSTAGD